MLHPDPRRHSKSTPVPETAAQLTGLVLACYQRVFYAIEPRLSGAADRCALNLARELRQHGLRVDLRVHRTNSELRINTRVLVLVYPVRHLTEWHLTHLRSRVHAETWGAGLVISFASARPRHRRILQETTERRT